MEQIWDILKRLRPETTQPPQTILPAGERRRLFVAKVEEYRKKYQPEFTCAHCEDKGVVNLRRPDNSVDYAATVPCRHCISPEKLRQYLGVSSLDATFSNFKPVKGAEKALAAAQDLCSLATTWKLLLLYGTWVDWKTHLMESISLDLWSKGISARVLTFPAFIGSLKNTFDKKELEGQSFDELINSVCVRPYLLLDDVGSADSFTSWSLSQLEKIMLARYRDNLLTVITTNMDYKKLPGFLVSRFSDAEKGRIVFNSAPDYRPKK